MKLHRYNLWPFHRNNQHFRQFHPHNPTVTLMRTTVAENEALGRELGEKASRAPRGTASILLPARGVSAIDAAGGPFEDASARRALFAAIERSAGATPVRALDAHINDPEFARACAEELLRLLAACGAVATAR